MEFSLCACMRACMCVNNRLCCDKWSLKEKRDLKSGEHILLLHYQDLLNLMPWGCHKDEFHFHDHAKQGI